MGCGCKKKNTEPTQPTQTTTQSSTQTTDQSTTQVQDQVVQVSVQLREMIEKKEL